MSLESPNNNPPIIEELRKKHVKPKELPILDMNKNQDGKFEVGGNKEFKLPGEKVKSQLEINVNNSIKKNIISIIKKQASKINLKISITEKPGPIVSTLTVVLDGRRRDVESMAELVKSIFKLFENDI